jgi:hypothetical protein
MVAQVFFFALFRLSLSSSSWFTCTLLVTGHLKPTKLRENPIEKFHLSDQHKSKHTVFVKVHLCLKKKSNPFAILLFLILKICSDKKEISTNLSQIQAIKDVTGVYENEAVQLRVNLGFMKDRSFIPLMCQEH